MSRWDYKPRSPVGPGCEQEAEDKSSGLHVPPAVQLETRARGGDTPESGLGHTVLESGPCCPPMGRHRGRQGLLGGGLQAAGTLNPHGRHEASLTDTASSGLGHGAVGVVPGRAHPPGRAVPGLAPDPATKPRNQPCALVPSDWKFYVFFP